MRHVLSHRRPILSRMNLAPFLSSLAVGTPVLFGDVTLLPLLGKPGLDLFRVDLLDEGMRDGRTVVTEIDREGRVNEVLVAHRGPNLLLLLDGEQILGAKQNRVVNASFLVAAGETTAIPVSCVERGRWEARGDEFAAADATIAPTMRARKLARVTRSVLENGAYDADQHAVWRDVDEHLHATKTSSPTSAYEDGARGDGAQTERRLGELAPLEHQLGLAMLRRGKFVLAEVFGTPELFARAWRKVARGLLVEAKTARKSTGASLAPGRARRALAWLAELPTRRSPAPGRGETIHGSGEVGTVSAIVHEGRVFHLVGAAA